MASGWGPAAQISGGSIQRLLLENSVLDISGGEIYSVENMNPQSTINISNGYVRGLEGRNEVTFNITGGDVGTELFMQDYSTANISAGNYQMIDGRGHSSINLSGGQFMDVGVGEESSLDLSGGTAEHIALWESATGEISGGTIQELFATGHSIIDIFGGEILWFLCADDFSVVNMYGYGFHYDPYGGGYTGGRLTGFRLDDTAFKIDFLDSSPTDSTYYDHVRLVPEPATLLLLGLGGLALRKRKRVV
jgi:hypothetical protein